MHLVMRSSLAKGERSFLSPKRSPAVRELVYRVAKTQGVKIYRFANRGKTPFANIELEIVAVAPGTAE
jgi:hypothetical protein